MDNYPNVVKEDLPSIKNVLDFIVRLRKQDVIDFNNLPSVFMSGRKVGKVPSSSTDIVATDKVGDFNYSTSFLYICVNNAGTAVWRRFTAGSW